ncbi:MAG: PEP-utilizing enzyme [Patescibacteria group bacterium]|nr:PEP-utilizing enzyme [Patescibacteria group bacterium]
MNNKIWRKNFEIKQIEYIMMSEAMESIFNFQKPTVKKNYLNQSFAVFENGDNTGTYFLKNELRNFIKNIIKEIISGPERIKKIQNKATEYNQAYFDKLKKIEKIKYEKLSSRQLVKIFYQLFNLMYLSHGYALATTWFVDSDGEDLSDYLINLIKDKIKQNKLLLNLPEVFSILTTPEKESFAQKEELEMLAILELIMADRTACKIFKQKDLIKIESQLKNINKKLYNKIIAHYKKWRWAPYTYIGPAYNLDYYLSIWSSLIRQKVNPKKEVRRLIAARENTIKRRNQLIKILNLNKKEIKIFDVAAQIIWLKALRKDVLFYGIYIHDKILKELGRREGFSLMQMKYVAGQEIKNYKKFSPDELNQRYKFSVMFSRRGKIKIYTGEQAKIFLKKQKLEKIIIKKSSELKGTVAFIGKAKGQVKIINLPEEMHKMEEGDIMVAHSTFPSLVSAMKKASAIVTDDGGITCHAAIVARELKIPCVVGTKIATQVLHDGDLVEVDADKGIVKILK